MIKLATWVGKIATSTYEYAEQGSQYVMEYGIEHDFNGSTDDYTFVMVTNFEKPRAEKVIKKTIKTRDHLDKELEDLLNHGICTKKSKTIEGKFLEAKAQLLRGE